MFGKNIAHDLGKERHGKNGLKWFIKQLAPKMGLWSLFEKKQKWRGYFINLESCGLYLELNPKYEQPIILKMGIGP